MGGGLMGESRNGLQTPCKQPTIQGEKRGRGWWGNPWGFESPLRHHWNNYREFGFAPGSLFPFLWAEWLIYGSLNLFLVLAVLLIVAVWRWGGPGATPVARRRSHSDGLTGVKAGG